LVDIAEHSLLRNTAPSVSNSLKRMTTTANMGDALATESSQGKVASERYCITSISSSQDFRTYHASLRDLLQICVNSEPASSSIGFHSPLSDEEADDYWLDVASKLDQAPRTMYLLTLTASSESGDVLATAQIHIVPKVTHRHRAEVAKLLVHPSARRRGVATAMMDFVEKYARDELDREMLNLDTAVGTSAVKFYRRTGWTEWGVCPEYAEFADGRRGSAMFFVKFIRHGSERPN
jgi:GNAT superfamily N-acetyltransferase